VPQRCHRKTLWIAEATEFINVQKNMLRYRDITVILDRNTADSIIT